MLKYIFYIIIPALFLGCDDKIEKKPLPPLSENASCSDKSKRILDECCNERSCGTEGRRETCHGLSRMTFDECMVEKHGIIIPQMIKEPEKE